MEGRRWISLRELSGIVSLPIKSLYVLAGRGLLPMARIGKRILVDRKAFEAKLEAQAAGGPSRRKG